MFKVNIYVKVEPDPETEELFKTRAKAEQESEHLDSLLGGDIFTTVVECDENGVGI